MAEQSGISWTHATFNPWRGCVEVSPACDHCYAATMSKRNPAVLGRWGADGTRVVAAEKYWREPLKWNADAEKAGERRRVFCASLADVFEDWQGPMIDHQGKRLWVSTRGTQSWEPDDGTPGFAFDRRPLNMNDVLARTFGVMKVTPWLDWLVLTKRPENIRRKWIPFEEHYAPAYVSGGEIVGPDYVEELYRPNVWLGCTVENQEQADKRIPELLRCRDLAPVLFLSCEPLLGPLDLSHWLAIEEDRDGSWRPETKFGRQSEISWTITGGESGPNARPSNPAWFRSIRDQCAAAGVPFHHKQNGEWVDELHPAAEDIDDPKKLDDRFVEITQTPCGKQADYKGVYMARVGVKAAGRLLDGVLHDAFPAVKVNA